MADAVDPAVQPVADLADDREKALDLPKSFCERFYWINDHPDYQVEVREFESGVQAAAHRARAQRIG
jgi:hypothetical protein